MSRDKLRPELVDICPPRMSGKPIDERGYSVPWFVARIDGKFDFRIADAQKRFLAIKFKMCWVCGEKLGRHLTFCIGPMCLVNRVTSEPPSHLECATYAVKGCPFLTRPAAQYRTAKLPEGLSDPPGVPLMHNPTAVCLYTTRSFSIMPIGTDYLLKLGPPDTVTFWHRGREATREEVDAAIGVGFPKVRAMAEQEGPAALAELDRMVEEARPWLPAYAPEVRP